jgi:acetylornithine deacetylase/succinyl-diaminopimelate desuccinylase-like protein
MIEAVASYLDQHRADFEADLMALLRIPSVSAQAQHDADTRKAAEFVADQLGRIGLTVEIIPTAGHPIVYAEWTKAPGQPTALVYGHYDVQPPDPLDQWVTPPFEPTIRDGNLHARGATDDKGQMLTHVKSVEAWLRTHGRLPLNVKFLIEGEEEVGSANLDPFVRAHRDRLACHWTVISDTSMFAPDTPAICYGLRGITYFEVVVQGPKQDLHSGGYGGMVANPANVLAELLSSLKDASGRIQLPGFYDAVLPLEEWERTGMAKLNFDEGELKTRLQVSDLPGEAGFSPLERKWARPTCDVCGLYGGYQGEGSKTIIPAMAGAKVSFRLVPRQDPRLVAKAFRQHLEARVPAGVRLEIKEYHSAPPVLVPVQSPGVEAARRAYRAGFGCDPVFIRNGGSIPVVSTFREILQVDCLLLGFGLPDDNTHSPNEKFCLKDYHRGIRTSAQLWQELAHVRAAHTAPAP